MQGRFGHFKGFTLLELLIALAIVAILVTVAVPPLDDFVARQKAQEVSQGVVSQMRAARALAVTTGKNVIICGSNNGHDCVKTQFTQILVFSDDNRDKKMDGDELQLVVRSFDTRMGNLRLGASNRSYVQYSPDGFATPGSFIFCPRQSDKRYLIQRISANKTGRSYVGPIEKEYGEVRMADTHDKIDCTSV